MTRHLFSAEEDALICELYPDTSTKVIAQRLRRTVEAVYGAAARRGLRKSAEYLAGPLACRLRRGDNVGKATRFKPGTVPPNKGQRRPGYAPGRMAETQFKPGIRQGIAAENWCPIGTIRPDTDGCLRIKVREGRKGEAYGFGNVEIWPQLHRRLWEQHHGPIPPNHVVALKDGDQANVVIENLECISRKDLMRRNSVHNLPNDLAEVIQLSGALKRQLRKHEKQNDRPAQPSL